MRTRTPLRYKLTKGGIVRFGRIPAGRWASRRCGGSCRFPFSSASDYVTVTFWSSMVVGWEDNKTAAPVCHQEWSAASTTDEALLYCRTSRYYERFVD